MKYRNPFVVALLHLITFGIYGIYWLYKTRREIISHNNNPASIPRVIVLFLPLFVFIAITLLMVFMNYNSSGADGADPAGAVAGILFGAGSFIAMIVLPFWWFYKYNMAVAKITGKTEGGVLYIVWIVCLLASLYIIWPAVVQNDLNKVAAS